MKTVLDKGFVKLDDVMADDLSVVNSARVSFGKHSMEMEDKDKGLIGFLMRERHGTPFEHNSFRFHIKAPIFVTRQWMRHRIGSFNEYSLRYSEMIEDFYIPRMDDIRKQTGKPGAYKFEPVTSPTAMYAQKKMEETYQKALDAYKQMIGEGVAKELARIILPVGLYTEFYWTVNARSLMNFISLRNSDTAQFEIREYAKVVEELFAEYMPVTHKAFIEHGRIAP